MSTENFLVIVYITNTEIKKLYSPTTKLSGLVNCGAQFEASCSMFKTATDSFNALPQQLQSISEAVYSLID